MSALTSVLENGSVVKAVRAGAIGYLLKDTQSAELIRSIKAAAATWRSASAQELEAVARVSAAASIMEIHAQGALEHNPVQNSL